MKTFKPFLLLLSFIFTLGCMRAAEGDKLKQELDKTKKELKKYTKNQASWEKKVQSSLKQSDSQIAQLNVLTQKLNNNLPKSYASLSVELEQIRQHIQGLTGKYEETQFKNSQMSESLKELGQKINNFETNFSSIRGIDQSSADRVYNNFAWPKNVKEAYNKALQYESLGYRELSLRLWGEIPKRWPKNKKISALAQFRRADLLFSERRYKESLTILNSLLAFKELAGLEAEIRFKLGYIFFLQGDFQKANALFDHCASKFKKLEYGKNCGDWIITLRNLIPQKKKKRKKKRRYKKKKKRKSK